MNDKESGENIKFLEFSHVSKVQRKYGNKSLDKELFFLHGN